LGEFSAARPWLERAIRNATEHSFNQLLFEAERALATGGPERVTTPVRQTFTVSSEVSAIAAELRGMRELAGV
jgi:hypothetical protein